MIALNFNIRNPWSDRFKNLWSRRGSLPIKHKHWELEILQGADIVQLMLNVTHRQSHGGLEIEIGALGYNIHFVIYDSRHWDYITETWVSND